MGTRDVERDSLVIERKPRAPLRLAGSPSANGERKLQIASGHWIELDAPTQLVRLHSPTGEVQLTIKVTPDGPVLSFASVALQFVSARELRLDVDTLNVHVRKEAVIEARGSVSAHVGGDHTLHCEGDVHVEASDIRAMAHGREMSLHAAGDLRVDGERVLINCDDR